MGNAVGPVALIAAGIYLGYLTLVGRAANLVAFLKSGGQSVPAATPTTTTTNAPSAATVAANKAAGAYGDGLSGSGANAYATNWDPASAYSAPSGAAQMLNALQQNGLSGGAAASGSYVPVGA